MDYEGQELSGGVELDGNRFVNCNFREATLIYRGGAAPQLINCTFDPAQIEFQDAAANTVRLLGAMAQPDSGLRYLAARLFWQILGHEGADPADTSGLSVDASQPQS